MKKILYLIFIILINCKNNQINFNNTNAFRDALKKVPKSAIFSMSDYYLWDPSIIKVDETYHLFCSRWPKDSLMNGWKRSEIIRAESNSLFGPYEFKQIVLQPKNHPWASQGIHNPKIIKYDSIFLIYHLGIPKWHSGFCISNNIEGPWLPFNTPSINTGNPSLIINKDGSIYCLGKKRLRNLTDNTHDYYLEGYTASNIYDKFTPLKTSNNKSKNLLPNNYQLEDPTLWYANNKYNIICNDWKAKASGIEKALIWYTSLDGINYKLESKIPIWSKYEGVPLEDNTTVPIKRLERSQVFLNEKNEVIALTAAILPENNSPSYIIIRPVNNFISN